MNPIEELAEYEKKLIEELCQYIDNPDLWVYDAKKCILTYDVHVLRVTSKYACYTYKGYYVQILPWELLNTLFPKIEELAKYKLAEQKLVKFKKKSNSLWRTIINSLTNWDE